MLLTPQQKEILRLIYADARKFPHELVTFIPDQTGANELVECGLIESRAGGYLLTEKGKDVCDWMGLL